MITLALDTSTAVGSVALLRDDSVLGEHSFRRNQSGENVFDAAQALLRESQLAAGDVELVAVGTGPGSFAGIRAGIAAAKGFALPNRLPIKAVGSFDALAMRALPEMPRECRQLCVLGDARRGEVYYALYDVTGQHSGSCRIGSLESIALEACTPIWFVSSEIERFGSDLLRLTGGATTVCVSPRYPGAIEIGKLGVNRFRHGGGRGDERIEPIYLRVAQYTVAR